MGSVIDPNSQDFGAFHMVHKELELDQLAFKPI